MTSIVEEHTYTSGHVARVTGLTFRRIDIWCHANILPFKVSGRGPGVYRRFSEEDVVIARVLSRLAEAGRESPMFLRAVSQDLQNYGRELLSNRFVVVDGNGTCELADSPHEVLLSIDLMQAKHLTSVVELW